MVLGEGAGALMLESLEHAQARGAKIWGEIIGHGAAMVGPTVAERDYLRESLRTALQATLRSCGPSLPSEWHLHAHGQSTPQADVSEALAIADVLAATGNPSAPVVAAKSYFGNLGAGSAAVEIIASLLALERGRLFPIRNLQRPIASAAWSKASTQTPAGQGFIHNSFTSQGQAACIAIASLKPGQIEKS